MNKTALITGASSGIGLELSRVFARNNNDLVIVARTEDKLNSLKSEIEKEYKVKVTVFTCDLSEKDAALKVFDFVKSENIEITYLINNAGFGDFGAFETTSWDKELQMIDLNISTLTHFCKLYIPEMKKQGGGKIMNVASTAGFQPGPYMAVYFATKNYVLAFSEAIDSELMGSNVTVTALCPGATASGFQNAANANKSSLFNGNIPSSKEVAEYGYKALMNEKRVAIHGVMNNILAFSTRLAPRNMVTWLTKKIVK